MQRTITNALLALFFAALLGACNSSENGDNLVNPTKNQARQSPPPSPANPAITYMATKQYKYRGVIYNVPSVYVMDADGSHQTMLWNNFVTNGISGSYSTINFPTWSSNSQKLCFNMDGRDLYTLTISLVNGVPIGSNATKICDGVASGGNYRKGVWSPTTTEIAFVWQHTLDPSKIQIVPMIGGTPATLYTSPSTDFTVSDYLAYNPEGTKIAFTEKQISTGINFLKIIERSTGNIIQTIDMSQFYLFTGLDWSRTPGSTLIAFSVRPPYGNFSQAAKVYTIDVGANSAPVLRLTSYNSVAFAPDDSQLLVLGLPGGTVYNLLTKYTFGSNNTMYLNRQGQEPDWKR